MKFPKFWDRVQNPRGSVTARGWSEISLEQATANARDRLQRILAALGSQKKFDLERYSYVIDNVICEQVIDRIQDGDRDQAVISRNSYGSLIMNAANMMFVDIDLPKPPKPGWISRWFRKPSPAPVLSPEAETLERIRNWQSGNGDTTLRVYRTHAGFRVIVVNRMFDSVDAHAVSIMNELGSDSLYVTLCQSQSCFRARLTPKPWRVGMTKPPKMFPFFSPADEAAFDAWYQQYSAQSKQFKVCIFVETLGRAAIAPQHQQLIAQHDAFCCDPSDLPLA